jgi:hypothetical protein
MIKNSHVIRMKKMVMANFSALFRYLPEVTEENKIHYDIKITVF